MAGREGLWLRTLDVAEDVWWSDFEERELMRSAFCWAMSMGLVLLSNAVSLSILPRTAWCESRLAREALRLSFVPLLLSSSGRTAFWPMMVGILGCDCCKCYWQRASPLKGRKRNEKEPRG